MGIGSVFLTRRTASATETIRKGMERQQWPQEAVAPAPANSAMVTLERSGNR
jgi:hypothetical protein